MTGAPFPADSTEPVQIAHYRSQIEALQQSQQCTAELLNLGEAFCNQSIDDPEAHKNTQNSKAQHPHAPQNPHTVLGEVIISLYCDREHLDELAKAIDLKRSHQSHWKGLLDMGRIEDILILASKKLCLCTAQTQELQKFFGDFLENADLMRYADFRLAGHFVGSGVEAGCPRSRASASNIPACYGV